MWNRFQGIRSDDTTSMKFSTSSVAWFIISLILFFSVYHLMIQNEQTQQRSLNDLTIFTFWEPRHKIPGYLRLCMRTWRKVLPQYQILVLDYSNLSQFLDSKLLKQILSKDMSLPVQADAIRAAILRKYGGLWMDVDTIVMNSTFLSRIQEHELAMFGELRSNVQHIGFIYAKTTSRVLQPWVSGIKRHVRQFKLLNALKNLLLGSTSQLKISYPWHYLGNSILDPLLKDKNGSEYLRIDCKRSYVFPERYFLRQLPTTKDMYQEFYFSMGNVQRVFDVSPEIIMLHNSWTPTRYKEMSEEQFLKQEILLANLFNRIL